MVSLGALLNNLFSQTTSWLGNQQRSSSSLVELCEQLLSNKGEVTGLSLAQAIPVVANSIEVRAQWQTGSEAFKAAVGRAVRLRFVLQAAKLFGFRFRSAQGKQATRGQSQ